MGSYNTYFERMFCVLSLTFHRIQEKIKTRHGSGTVGFLQVVAGNQWYSNVRNVRTSDGRVENQDASYDADEHRGVTYNLKGRDFYSLQPAQHNFMHTPCFDTHSKKHTRKREMS